MYSNIYKGIAAQCLIPHLIPELKMTFAAAVKFAADVSMENEMQIMEFRTGVRLRFFFFLWEAFLVGSPFERLYLPFLGGAHCRGRTWRSSRRSSMPRSSKSGKLSKSSKLSKLFVKNTSEPNKMRDLQEPGKGQGG